MKKKSLICLVLVLVIVTTMCVCPISASAATVENTTTESVVTEDGWSYVEFTTRASNSYSEVITANDFYYTEGMLMEATGDYVSIAANASNSGLTINVKLKVKNEQTNLFYDIANGTTSFVCNGQSQLLYRSFPVHEGMIYRLYFKIAEDTDATQKITVVANFWS